LTAYQGSLETTGYPKKTWGLKGMERDGRECREMEGNGKRWKGMERDGREWKEMEENGKIWKGMEKRDGREWMEDE